MARDPRGRIDSWSISRVPVMAADNDVNNSSSGLQPQREIIYLPVVLSSSKYKLFYKQSKHSRNASRSVNPWYKYRANAFRDPIFTTIYYFIVRFVLREIFCILAIKKIAIFHERSSIDFFFLRCQYSINFFRHRSVPKVVYVRFE